jgi:protein O-mannosyl-transferase
VLVTQSQLESARSRAAGRGRIAAARSPAPRWLAPAVVAAVTLLAYHNSLLGPFIFDDFDAIAANPRIHRLWPLSGVLGGTARPFAALTFALNYAAGGLDVRGYHAVNLAIHALAALTLFAILRRTFAFTRGGGLDRGAAEGLALAAAALWAAHPLNTQAVTYVVQRAESLAALLYLLTLYAAIRGAASPARARGWYAAATLAAALGAATKPLLVSAPLLVLLYDRFFLAPSFRAALRSRGALYLGLAASWGVAIGLAIAAPDSAAGFELETVTPLAYAATQPGVVCHYLKLAFWPDPLVLDYGWPLASRASEIVGPALLLLGLGVVTIRAALKWEPAAYLGMWFLLVLAPSSSLFPIQDPAFEHRMYLPLVAPVVLLVVAGHALLARRPGLRPAVVGLAIVALAVACGLTIRRNHDYRSEVAIWSDTVAKRPHNPRANMSLGRALLRVHDAAGAMPHLAEAVRLAPRYPEAHNNMGAALAEQGRIEEATSEFRTALELKPGLTDARANLARALLRRSRFAEAEEEYRKLAGERPEDAEVHAGRGTALVGLGRYEPAVAEYEQALRIANGSAELHNNMGIALARLGRLDAAVEHFREALRLAPDFAPARENLDRALRQRG